MVFDVLLKIAKSVTTVPGLPYLSLILFDMHILYYIVALYVLAFHHVKSLTKKMCKKSQ